VIGDLVINETINRGVRSQCIQTAAAKVLIKFKKSEGLGDKHCDGRTARLSVSDKVVHRT